MADSQQNKDDRPQDQHDDSVDDNDSQSPGIEPSEVLSDVEQVHEEYNRVDENTAGSNSQSEEEQKQKIEEFHEFLKLNQKKSL